ncbi:MAG: D-aminoacyl-tRNA deacylase [Candidatus Baldrarchaeia archaeon]
MPTIITSTADIASMNIKERLIELYDFKETTRVIEGHPVYECEGIELVTINEDLVEAEHIDNILKSDLLIFASRHKSEMEVPALLVHAPGNWTINAPLGGRAKELAYTSAVAIKEALLELAEQKERLNLSEYDVTLEVSHHGPTSLSSPVVFVELGSSEKQWSDKKAAEAVAHAVMRACMNFGKKTYKVAIGFGGPHYAPQFTKVVLRTDFALSHIAPRYVLDELEEDMIKMAVSKTVEEVKYAILDWKGMKKEHKDAILPVLERLGLSVERTQRLLKG